MLKDPNFYVALGTILALVLSQLPPLRILLRRARLTLLPFRRIVLYHFLGNPNCNLFVILENKGGRTVTIDGITLEFTKDGKSAMTLPAQTYWHDMAAKVEYPLTRFHLAPGQTWAHTVHCYEEFNREDERRSRGLVNAIREDIAKQLEEERARGVKVEERISPLVARNNDHVLQAVRFFEEHFRYQVGEHILTIRVQCSPAAAFSPGTYRVTLFESDVETLKRQAEDFKYGDGIFYFTEGKERSISARLQSP